MKGRDTEWSGGGRSAGAVVSIAWGKRSTTSDTSSGTGVASSRARCIIANLDASDSLLASFLPRRVGT